MLSATVLMVVGRPTLCDIYMAALIVHPGIDFLHNL